MKSTIVLRFAAVATIAASLWACSASPSVVPAANGSGAAQNNAHRTVAPQDSDVPQTPH